MKILMTGCAGYIGSTLLEYLLGAGHDVLGVDNFMYNNSYALSSYLHHPKFHCRVENPLSYNFSHFKSLMRDIDVVIPLAALVGAPLCDRLPEEAVALNQKFIEDIVYVLKPYQKIIYPNTNSGYGIKEGMCTEEDELNPISLYGETKCAAEKAVLSHGNSVVFRLATVFGPSPRMRFDLMVNNLFYRYYKEGGLDMFEPQFRRNFVHVRDVARAFMFGLDRDFTGVYNLGNDDMNCTKMELAQKIENFILGPVALLGSKITVGDGKDPDQRDYNISSQKVRDAGFSFKYGFEEGFTQLETLCSGMTFEQFKQWRNY